MQLGSSLTTACFWLGTLLPLLYLPVFVSGIDSMSALSVLVALLAIHVVALVFGHGYEGSRTR